MINLNAKSLKKLMTLGLIFLSTALEVEAGTVGQQITVGEATFYPHKHLQVVLPQSEEGIQLKNKIGNKFIPDFFPTNLNIISADEHKVHNGSEEDNTMIRSVSNDEFKGIYRQGGVYIINLNQASVQTKGVISNHDENKYPLFSTTENGVPNRAILPGIIVTLKEDISEEELKNISTSLGLGEAVKLPVKFQSQYIFQTPSNLSSYDILEKSKLLQKNSAVESVFPNTWSTFTLR